MGSDSEYDTSQEDPDDFFDATALNMSEKHVNLMIKDEDFEMVPLTEK